eukprot:g47185.t1
MLRRHWRQQGIPVRIGGGSERVGMDVMALVSKPRVDSSGSSMGVMAVASEPLLTFSRVSLGPSIGISSCYIGGGDLSKVDPVAKDGTWETATQLLFGSAAGGGETVAERQHRDIKGGPSGNRHDSGIDPTFPELIQWPISGYAWRQRTANHLLPMVTANQTPNIGKNRSQSPVP